MAETTQTDETIYCEGCRSWPARTEPDLHDEPITPDELVKEWGWTQEQDEGEPLYFCPECS
jgi:hypothetical protein